MPTFGEILPQLLAENIMDDLHVNLSTNSLEFVDAAGRRLNLSDNLETLDKIQKEKTIKAGGHRCSLISILLTGTSTMPGHFSAVILHLQRYLMNQGDPTAFSITIPQGKGKKGGLIRRMILKVQAQIRLYRKKYFWHCTFEEI
ncbi:hypothetical protein Acr_00g0053450 [Actinidia rufa]|uniref:Uncharacterized protein n=2 Tax=Actinidia rufa TaxID=165716 RepID=A0A7J0DNB7_9ERIC|nr:hypothetical protein Acr_00g0053450 [Actinidia rufa]